MSRFFKQSKNIDDVSSEEIVEFLKKEKILGKVNVDRVHDFFNALSTITKSHKINDSESIDYSIFNANTGEDKHKVLEVRNSEKDFLNRVNPSILSGERLLKAAAALSYSFEKSMYGGSGDGAPDPNQTLSNMFDYYEEQKTKDEDLAFGDLLGLDMTFMRYIALLSSKPGFKSKVGKIEKDPGGNITKYSQMENMTEVFSSDMIQMVMPNFQKKLATLDMYIRSRFSKRPKGQNLIILVDDSGSMNNPVKINIIKAALTLKMREIDDNNNVYLGTFVQTVFGFVKISKSTRFEDLTMLKFNKGVTAVGECVLDTISRIKKRKLFGYTHEVLPLSEDHFEIMVINDGEDNVPNFHPDIKIHALCLLKSNNALKNICHRSGGTYFHLTGKD